MASSNVNTTTTIPQHSSAPCIDLKLIAYNRGFHPVTNCVNPYHWLIFAGTGPGVLGTVYQLRGMPGSFCYHGPEKLVDPGAEERSSREAEIGRIPAHEVSIMDDLIQAVPISKAEYGFNCQNWTESVLEQLAEKGWLDVEPKAIVSWFRDLERN